MEIKRPGRDEWESNADLGGAVPLADVVGTLVRYPSGLVLKVTGLTEPDAAGKRQMQMEIHGALDQAG